MTSDELAEAFAAFLSECRERITGVGKDQYDHGTEQRFENVPIDILFDELSEELEDVCVWTFQTWHRIQSLRRLMKHIEDVDTLASVYVSNLHAGRP